MDSAGTAGARRRPVAGRTGGPDSGSGDAGTGVIASSVPHPRRRGGRSPRPWKLAGRGKASGRVAGPAVTYGRPGPLRVTGVQQAETSIRHLLRAATSAGCWAPGCSPSSATASSRPRWPARCCSTRSGRPTRSTSPPASPSCCCRTPSSARSPASGWTGGAAGRCCCGRTCCGPGWSPSWRRWSSAASRAPAFYVGRAGRLLGQPVHPRRAVGGAAAHHRRAVAGLGQRAVDDVRRRWPPWSAAARRSLLLQLTGSGDAGLRRRGAGRGRCPTWRAAAVVAGFSPGLPRPRPHGRGAAGCRRATSLAAWWPAPGTSLGAPAGGGRAAGDRPAPARLRRPHADDAAALPQHVRGRRRPLPRRPRRAGRGGRGRGRGHAAGGRRHAAGGAADRQAAVDHRAARRRWAWRRSALGLPFVPPPSSWPGSSSGSCRRR